jgi:hypothetical protein
LTPSPEILLARKVPMWKACRAVGMRVAPRSDGAKTWCPFGHLFHPDGGDEPAFRLYGDHAFCFACWKYWTPSRLCADAWDVPEEVAAARLLDETDTRPPSWEERWDQIVSPEPPDLSQLADALRIYCSGEVQHAWEQARLDPGVSRMLTGCLGYLGQVTDDKSAREWLDLAKSVMGSALEGWKRHGTEEHVAHGGVDTAR